MDIANPTSETLSYKYDSTLYSFAPGDVVSVRDDAGEHLLRKLGPRGLIHVHYGMTSEQAKAMSAAQTLAWMKEQVRVHEDYNRKHEDQKIPPLPETDAIRKFRIAIPIYEAAVKEIKEKLGQDESEVEAKRIRAELAKEMAPPTRLEDASLEQLSAEARRLGLEPGSTISRSRLLNMIRKAIKLTGEE